MNKSSMAIGATAVFLVACGTTQQATVSPADLKCGFLGPACAQLSPGSEGQIALRYVNPAAKWTQYSKIMIQPVTFWGDEQSKVSTEDQQRLVNFLYTALDQELAKQFQIVDQDGPDVMKLQVALTDVAAAVEHGQAWRDRVLSVRGRRTGGVQAHRLDQWRAPGGGRGPAHRRRLHRDGGAVAMGRRRERDEGM